MWKNYFKTAFRQLARRKMYAGINIVGLSIGLLSFMAISLFIYHHWSYDRMFADNDRIFRISQLFEVGGNAQKVEVTPSILANVMHDDIPEVEQTARLFNVTMFGPTLVKTDGENQSEYKFCYADESFFELFQLPVLAGNPVKALATGEQLVITEATAKRYFGDVQSAMGAQMTVGNTRVYEVGAVLADLPDNIHFSYEFFAPFKILSAAKEPEWQPSNYITYVKLHKDVAVADVTAKLNDRVGELLAPMMAQMHFKVSFNFHELTSLHFGEEFLDGSKPTIDIKYLYIFGFAALLIILIAGINYVNLATAESGDKNKEVGIRKVMGADRLQLILMYLMEAGLLVAISLGLSFVLMYMFFPYFENLTGARPDANLLFSLQFVSFFVLIGLLITLLSGFYPSWLISTLQPVQSMKAKGLSIGKGGSLRKVLVIFQFCVSMFMIIATAVTYLQLNYIQNKNLGYEKDQVISMPIDWRVQEQVPALKQELQRLGLAQHAALSSDNPVSIKAGYRILEEGKDQDYAVSIRGMAGDAGMVNTLGIKMVAGADLVEEDYQGSGPDFHYQILINEATAKAMGYTAEEAVLKKADMGGRKSTIKGVFQDFHFSSLHEEIQPLVLFMEPEQGNYLLAKINGQDTKATLAQIAHSWKTLMPQRPFEYQFLDEKYNSLYKSEIKVGQVFTAFSIIAILIACLGLFGLVSFVANKRAKEISIRKVLGAGSFDVLKLLSKEFVVLLGIAAVIATAVGYYFSGNWLNNFAYKVEISPWVFLVAVGVVILVSMLTIWYKSLSAAAQNPVDNLKSE